MSAEDRQATMAHYNLDEDKVGKLITRAAQACLAYQRGEMTIKQVWYRARGDRFMMACQFYPDRDLGFSLWALADEFYTGLHRDGDEYWAEQIVIDSIFGVVKALRNDAGAVH